MWHHHFEFLLLGLRRLPDVLRLLQEGLPGDHRPDHRAHGGGHRGGDLPARRGAAAPGALRRGAGRRCAASAKERRPTTVMRVAASDRASRARDGSRSCEISRDPWFNINVGDGFYHYHRTWNDDLSMPFAGLPGYIAQREGGESLDRPVEQLLAERKQLIEDYRELLDHRRGARGLRPDDHAGAPRVPVRRGAQVLLRALVHEPVLQQDPRVRRAAGGARLLRRTPRTCSTSRTTSSRRAIIDLMTSWSNGSPPRGPQHWPPIVAERRAAIAEWAKHETPPALGPGAGRDR